MPLTNKLAPDPQLINHKGRIVFLEHMEYWHWWVLGVVLITLELFVTTSFFIWIGAAAGLVGLLLLIAPATGWQYQWLIFAVVSMVSIVLWRIYASKNPAGSDHPTLNRRGEQYVGRTFTLAEPIANGIGKIKVDDSMWKIAGEDCPIGSKIKVVETDGALLKVEVISKGEEN